MTQTVEQIAAAIIKREGGFNQVVGDHGGATNCGVSLRFAQNLAKVNGRSPMDLDGDGVVSVADIRLVTPAIAQKLFIQEFFVKPRIAELPACIQPILFDDAVNAGAGGAAHILQEGLNAMGFRVTVDGSIGDLTIAAAQRAVAKVGPTFFVNTLVRERIEFYQAIVAHDPSQAKFLKGWTNRANEFKLA